MAGKHQIWSSNKKTRQKANRCWRRQHRLRVRQEPLTAEPPPAQNPIDVEALKEGPWEYDSQRGFGTSLDGLLENAVTKRRQTTVAEFADMLRRWDACSVEQFAALFPEIPTGQREEHYQRFTAMPLEYVLGLTLEQQARFVTWLRDD